MSHINVTLRLAGQEVDLRLPEKMEIRKLIRELDRIFGLNHQRVKYQIRVLNKGILLEEGQHLAQTSVTTGDILEIEDL